MCNNSKVMSFFTLYDCVLMFFRLIKNKFLPKGTENNKNRKNAYHIVIAIAIVATGELGIGIRLLGPSKTWLDLTEPIGRWA